VIFCALDERKKDIGGQMNNECYCLQVQRRCCLKENIVCTMVLHVLTYERKISTYDRNFGLILLISRDEAGFVSFT
jgi:hypothetical protein